MILPVSLFLAKPPLPVERQFAEAKARAMLEGKRLFFAVGNQMCISCRRFDTDVREPVVQAALSRRHVFLGVNMDVEAARILRRLEGESVAIPFWLILDPATGKVIADAAVREGSDRFVPMPMRTQGLTLLLQGLKRSDPSISTDDLWRIRLKLGPDTVLAEIAARLSSTVKRAP
ncbi:hypothetical protein BH11ARM2_BH11ARM2_03340 [soil metagenome]